MWQRSASLLLALTSVACVSAGKIDQGGFTHNKMGYTLAFKDPSSKSFLPSSWSIELDKFGQFSPKSQGSYWAEAKSLDSDREFNLTVKEFDLQWKQKNTNGLISLQSFPLSEDKAHRNLDIFLKNYTELLAGQYFVAFGQGFNTTQMTKNFVTNVLHSKPRSTAEADILEAEFEVANAEQLRLNPEHRLMKYRIVMLRPKSMSQTWVEESVKNGKIIKDRFPAMVVMLYAMDYEYFDEYQADFTELVGRLSLRPKVSPL